jgi:hypothetical protein
VSGYWRRRFSVQFAHRSDIPRLRQTRPTVHAGRRAA